MAPASLIGVSGSTGAVGGRVARRLERLGVPQRLLVREKARAPSLNGAEVAEVGSYSDSAGMRRALAGVDTFFMVSGREAADRVQHHYSAVDAAVAAGVRRIVYLSFLAAAPEATFTFARDHFRTEEHIRKTGLRHTFLRASLYLDLMPETVWAEGIIKGPAAQGRVACIARDDLAEVAVAVITGQGHDALTYDVTGPEALTMAEIAGEMAEVTGRPITYQNETLEEARASRSVYGAPAWEVEGWVTSYAAIATGEMDVVSDTVPRLTGHPAQRVRDYLRAHPESWGQLTSAPAG